MRRALQLDGLAIERAESDPFGDRVLAVVDTIEVWWLAIDPHASSTKTAADDHDEEASDHHESTRARDGQAKDEGMMRTRNTPELKVLR
jgi:hypothetical protein